MVKLSQALHQALRISPLHSLFDTPLSIRVINCSTNEKYTLATSVSLPDGASFISHGTYTADSNGEIDTGAYSCESGSYEGVEPMGLLWSLAPKSTERRGTRMMPKGTQKPLEYNFRLLRGPRTKEEVEDASHSAVLHEQTVLRHLLHPHVERIELEESNAGHLRGALFVPKNADKTTPGIIDLFGSGGGLIEHRAALLANKGYVVLALAYLLYKDLPPNLEYTNLDYFQDAIDWFRQFPRLDANNIGMQGVSFGGDITQLTLSLLEGVKAGIAINPWHTSNSFFPIRVHGKLWPKAELHISPAKSVKSNNGNDKQLPLRPDEQFIVDGAFVWANVLKTVRFDEEIAFPVHKMPSSKHICFYASEDDLNINSADVVQWQIASMHKHGRGAQCEAHYFVGAGHLFEPPYIPLCTEIWHKLAGCYFLEGGKNPQHAHAQERAWQHMQTYWRERIGPPCLMEPFDTAFDVNTNANL